MTNRGWGPDIKIYWAGPLFTAAERQWNVSMTEKLESLGYFVWLPQEKEPREKTAYSIFAIDKEGIDWADVVIAVMDGPDPDSGTCWECGYAFGTNKPVINLRTDFRNNGDIDDAKINLMLHASARVNVNVPFQSDYQIIEFLHKALKEVTQKV